MRWLRKATPSIPVVPDDRAEREAAIERSRQSLSEARGKIEDVDRVVAAVTGHDLRNHYRDRLLLAYGEKP